MSEFVTRMGRIKKRNETRLTWKNQRKLGKAIRGAKMRGIIPLHSRRVLRKDKPLAEVFGPTRSFS